MIGNLQKGSAVECRQCTYSQEQEADYSQTSSSGTRQLSLLNGTDIAAKSSAKEPQMDGSPTCKCGKGMSGCSIHPNTREEWIASMRDSLAKMLAKPENRQGLAKKLAVAYTVKPSASLAFYDRTTSSLKTLQQSFLTDCQSLSVTLSRSGMTLNGFVYELPIVGRRITETDGGVWLGTPTATFKPRSERFRSGDGSQRMPNPAEAASMMWPTPTAHNAKETAAPSEGMRNTPTLAHHPGGRLNPEWVEWLMGFPIGQTVLKRSAMPKSRSNQQPHGSCSEAQMTDARQPSVQVLPTNEQNAVDPASVMETLQLTEFIERDVL